MKASILSTQIATWFIVFLALPCNLKITHYTITMTCATMCANSQRSIQNEGLRISENLIFFKSNIFLRHTETNVFLGFSQAQESKQMCLENTFSVLPLKVSSLSLQLLNEIDIPSSAISWHRLIQMDRLLWSLIVQKPISGMPHEVMGILLETVVPRSSGYLKSRTFRFIVVNFNENSL